MRLQARQTTKLFCSTQLYYIKALDFKRHKVKKKVKKFLLEKRYIFFNYIMDITTFFPGKKRDLSDQSKK